MPRTLTVATCQFPVSADIVENEKYISRQLWAAKARGADVAQFPEGALSGYAGVDFENFDGFDWEQLVTSTRSILARARELDIWVVLGSSHRLSGKHKPHNSLYIIDDGGRIVDRYDKMFCAGDRAGTVGDLAHFTPGDHFSVFTINGVKCGTLICHEYRYPELFREYHRLGIRVLFHSFHAGNISVERWAEMREQVGLANLRHNPGETLPGITMPAAMHSAAADNALWISCSNTSARQSCWGNFVVRPDGVIVGRVRRNVPGMLLTTIDPEEAFYDSTAPWRKRAMEGTFHSGKLVKDNRSSDRTSL